MSDHVWYSTANSHNERELTIVNAALLISKPPTKEKRVRVKVRMLLSGTVNMGSPEWLDKAYSYVAESGDKICPQLDLRGYDLKFSADNLFDKDGVSASHCDMRSFEIVEFGPAEEPDVVVNFCLYLPFSTALWSYLGQYGGELVWCSFTPGVPDVQPTSPDDQPMLTSGDNDEDDEEPEDDLDDEEAEEIDAEADTDNEAAQDDTQDVVLEDAMQIFESHGKVSAVELQRVLSISYVKAAHVIEKMQAKGMVSKPDVNGVRSLIAQGNKPATSGPKDLAAYHEKVLEAEPEKKKRGRPRKDTVNPLTVDAATAF